MGEPARFLLALETDLQSAWDLEFFDDPVRAAERARLLCLKERGFVGLFDLDAHPLLDVIDVDFTVAFVTPCPPIPLPGPDYRDEAFTFLRDEFGSLEHIHGDGPLLRVVESTDTQLRFGDLSNHPDSLCLGIRLLFDDRDHRLLGAFDLRSQTPTKLALYATASFAVDGSQRKSEGPVTY